jgi:hypothetical protein
MDYTRQWLRCDASGSDCAPIAGATAANHVATAADVGSTLRIAVTAQNAAGPVTSTSAATVVIGAKAPPVASVAPSVSGTPVDGLELTAVEGTWTGTSGITRTVRWLRCDDTTLASCAPVTVSVPARLRLAGGDVGKLLRIEVTATNPDGTTTATSEPTAPVAPAAPAATAAPTVGGVVREGQVLTAARGTWTGTAPISFTHAWQRCTTDGCVDIAGESALTYRLGPDDLGQTVRHAVTATNAANTAVTAYSVQTATVTAGPPVAMLPPTITGDVPRDGELWTSTLGTWAGTAPLQQRRQWMTCSSTGAACTPMVGQIGETLRLTPSDVGRTVRLEVTTENTQGTIKALSAASAPIAPAPPTPNGALTVSGELRDGAQVAIAGSWNGTPQITFTYAWQRCQALADVCEDIAGATTASHRLTSADVGSRVRVRVGAINAAGGGAATTVISSVVGADPPRSTVAPVLSGTPVEQGSLAVSTGTFSGTSPLTHTYQWQRCDDRGLACVDIAGATQPTRVLDQADRGSTLRARVRATNSAASADAWTAVSAVVAPAAPRNVVAPAISPDTGLKDGITVTATTGGWVGSAPIEHAWRWQRCTAAGDRCVDIPGAGSASYELVTADVGSRMRATVTATGPGGTAAQLSQLTGVVSTNPPVNIVAPAVTGTAQDGQELRADTGSWTGLVPFVTTYRWFRCDTNGANCGVVPNASASTYRLGPGDVGYSVLTEVTQTNVGGGTAARSLASAVVVAAPPSSIVAPRIMGGAAVGKTLTAEPGVWAGTPELRFAYQWSRCAP